METFIVLSRKLSTIYIFFNENDKYYQEIVKHYQNKDEILVLDSNSTGVKIRTFDQMANLKRILFKSIIWISF